MSRRPRLSDADWHTIRIALNDAMDERESYADAWPEGTPERAKALARVQQYEGLHRKMFGESSARQQDLERWAACPTVSLTELMCDTD